MFSPGKRRLLTSSLFFISNLLCCSCGIANQQVPTTTLDDRPIEVAITPKVGAPVVAAQLRGARGLEDSCSYPKVSSTTWTSKYVVVFTWCEEVTVRTNQQLVLNITSPESQASITGIDITSANLDASDESQLTVDLESYLSEGILFSLKLSEASVRGLTTNEVNRDFTTALFYVKSSSDSTTASTGDSSTTEASAVVVVTTTTAEPDEASDLAIVVEAEDLGFWTVVLALTLGFSLCLGCCIGIALKLRSRRNGVERFDSQEANKESETEQEQMTFQWSLWGSKNPQKKSKAKSPTQDGVVKKGMFRKRRRTPPEAVDNNDREELGRLGLTRTLTRHWQNAQKLATRAVPRRGNRRLGVGLTPVQRVAQARRHSRQEDLRAAAFEGRSGSKNSVPGDPLRDDKPKLLMAETHSHRQQHQHMHGSRNPSKQSARTSSKDSSIQHIRLNH